MNGAALHPAVIFLGGLVVILLGAETLLRSASRVAALLGLSPIVIGLTIVAIGTSTPELAVGIVAAAEGKGPLAVANIAGTNIVNILLILGLSAAIRPLPIRRRTIRFDVPAMIGCAIALVLMAMDGVLTRVEGMLLLLAAVGYTYTVIRGSPRESAAIKEDFTKEFAIVPPPRSERRLHYVWHGGQLLVGIALLVLGADLLVSGAVQVAVRYGVSDAIIGLTIVAIGTSAPELVTTIVATYRNDRDVAIGNLIGSSVYNILAILGLTMVVAPRGIDVGREILWFDLPLAAAVAVICYPVFKSGRMVSRREGFAFVTAYAVYLAWLVVMRT